MSQHRQYPDAAAKQRAYRARQLQARLTEQQANGLPPVPPLPTLPSRARWQALLERARLSLQTTHDEKQANYEERSEAWQQGEHAAALQDHLDALAQTLDDLDALPPFSTRLTRDVPAPAVGIRAAGAAAASRVLLMTGADQVVSALKWGLGHSR